MAPPSRLARAGGIPASAIPEPAAPPPATRFAQAAARIARGELVTLPYFGPAYIQIIAHTASNEIEGEVMAAMAAARIPERAEFAFSFDIERTARTLARAARDPDDHAVPFGTLEEWLGMDDDVIMACGFALQDVRNRLDPIGAGVLTEDLAAELRLSFEKKNPAPLRACGVGLLVTWLLSGAVQLSSSPTPASSSGDTSADD